jgi:SNF2 family DNA or RNA helicase
MLISKKHRKIIFNSRHPERIMTVIPTAKTLVYRGQRLVAVPHNVEETRVLRNIGYDVPSPISYYYEWAGRYSPFVHQRVTSEFLTMHSRAFVLNQIGTGKTMSTLWALDYLMTAKLCRKALIVSPLSTLERVWADEIFRHFPNRTYAVLHGSKQRRVQLLAQDVDFFIINHDGLKVIQEELLGKMEIDAVVVDELAEFRNASTDRWKSLHAVTSGRQWVWGLTGSPTPKAPTDAWAQCRLIAPDKVPKYFGKFRDQVMRQINTFKWIPRNEAAHIVKEAMQPAILYKREECLDLPPCTFSTRKVELSTEQKKAYKDMLEKLRLEYQGGEVTAINEAVKAMKLVQVACGVAYATDGEHVVIPSEERIKAVLEIVEEADGKVIVYVPLTGGLQLIAKELEQAGYRVGVVHGETPKSERDRIFSEFQDSDDGLEVLVAHPKCMSHGLTLTRANVIVWYIPTNDFAVYEQACGRIVRQGQTRHQHIIHLEGSNIEQKMYNRLEHRGAMQGVLLDLIKKEMEET